MSSVLVVHPGSEMYGSDRMLIETITGLRERGSKVVAALPTHGPLADELAATGVDVRICPMPVLRKSALSLGGMWQLMRQTLSSLRPAWRLIRASRADTVLVNTMIIPMWLILARLAGLRAVCHVHEAEHSAPRLVRLALYAPLLSASAVVLNSRFSKTVLAETLPLVGRRSTVVYNGVPGPAEPPTPPRPDPQAPGPVRLLFVGRLSPRKGPQVAVEALDLLVRRGVEAHLDLLGAVFEGYEWFEAELRARIERLGLGDRVTFHGFHPDVWSFLARCDICLVPSVLDEPFGNTAVEAVLAARPLVVSATSGLLEAAAGYSTARSVPPGDAEALAGAVEEMLRGWPAIRSAVEPARRAAAERHAPGRYRRALADATVPPAPPAHGAGASWRLSGLRG